MGHRTRNWMEVGMEAKDSVTLDEKCVAAINPDAFRLREL